MTSKQQSSNTHARLQVNCCLAAAPAMQLRAQEFESCHAILNDATQGQTVHAGGACCGVLLLVAADRPAADTKFSTAYRRVQGPERTNGTLDLR
jgi:hypothetical protein